MPIQISSREIDSTQIVGYVKSLGFSIFFGRARTPFNAEVFWSKDTGGDFKDFLRVAKSEGVRVIIVDWDALEEDEIEDDISPLLEDDIAGDEAKRAKISNRNQRLESLKTNIGKTGYIAISWLKDNTEYIYTQTTEWWDEFRRIEDEIEKEEE